jgi:hypothetical protein
MLATWPCPLLSSRAFLLGTGTLLRLDGWTGWDRVVDLFRSLFRYLIRKAARFHVVAKLRPRGPFSRYARRLERLLVRLVIATASAAVFLLNASEAHHPGAARSQFSRTPSGVINE